jgi:hypothetical protein
MALLDAHSLDTNLFFLHRGVIQPKSGIGAHFHNQCEEMFIIFDGEAQFTIDGRTSLLRGPAGALPDGTLSRVSLRKSVSAPLIIGQHCRKAHKQGTCRKP